MKCISIGTGIIECESGPEEGRLRQRLTDFIPFNQTLNRGGSIYNRSVSNEMTLRQSDYLLESVASVITFSQEVVHAKEFFPISVSNTLTLIDGVSVAGGRYPTGGGGSTTVVGIFDSLTLKGMALYVPSTGHVDLAHADAIGTSVVVGIANQDVAAAATGEYVTEGQVERSDWTAVAGTADLDPGATYYLSQTTAGAITVSAPTVDGDIVVAVGRALTTKVLDVEIAEPILL